MTIGTPSGLAGFVSEALTLIGAYLSNQIAGRGGNSFQLLVKQGIARDFHTGHGHRCNKRQSEGSFDEKTAFPLLSEAAEKFAESGHGAGLNGSLRTAMLARMRIFPSAPNTGSKSGVRAGQSTSTV